MKKILLIFLTAIAIGFTGCSKDKAPTPDKKKFEITDIVPDKEKIIVGQRVEFTPSISDNTGNITYNWELILNGERIGSPLYGDIKIASINFSEASEYIIRLTITRGESEKFTFDKKINPVNGVFQYATWGDLQKTIEQAESDNGYSKADGLKWIPEIIPGNEGVTYRRYSKNFGDYVYYFKDDKFIGGGYVYSIPYTNTFTDLRGAYNHFLTTKDQLSETIGAVMPETFNWVIEDQERIDYYSASISTISEAVGLDYLRLSSNATGENGTANIEFRRIYPSSVRVSYTIIAP